MNKNVGQQRGQKRDRKTENSRAKERIKEKIKQRQTHRDSLRHWSLPVLLKVAMFEFIYNTFAVCVPYSICHFLYRLWLCAEGERERVRKAHTYIYRHTRIYECTKVLTILFESEKKLGEKKHTVMRVPFPSFSLWQNKNSKLFLTHFFTSFWMFSHGPQIFSVPYFFRAQL